MINTSHFGAELKTLGYEFYSGVPCSYLKALINFAINECEYVMAVNEGDAVAISAGASIGGKKSVVLMQNSGLTNAISPLTSLISPFQIPILGFVSLRGESGHKDEPQHELMGETTAEMLSLMKIKWEYLSYDFNEAKSQLRRANGVIEQNEPYFFIVKKGVFESISLDEKPLNKTINRIKHSRMETDELPTRYEVLQIISSMKDHHTVQLATTGKTGRELYELEDSPHNFYMVGSMGCISSIGLGLALTKKDKQVVAIDGDGALLMRMGHLATNGYYCPQNLLHIMLDNHTHDSTGGQFTVSENVNFIDIASACGYVNAFYVHNLKQLQSYIKEWKKNPELTFLYMKIAKGSKKHLGRPKMKPFEVKERLQVFLNG